MAGNSLVPFGQILPWLAAAQTQGRESMSYSRLGQAPSTASPLAEMAALQAGGQSEPLAAQAARQAFGNPMAAALARQAAPAAASASPYTGWLGAKLTGGATEGLGLRSLAAGSLGRAGLYGVAGQLGSMGVKKFWNDPNSSADNALAGAVGGAGLGAGVGSLIAPGPGTLIGGALGAAGGGLYGWLTSKDEGDKAVASELNKQSTKIATILTQLGSSPDLREQALAQLQIGAAQAGSKDDVRKVAAQVQQMLPEAVLQEQTTEQQDRKRQAAQAAVQAWMGPMLKDQLSKSQWYADQFANASRGAADQIEDPQMRAAQQAMAANISSSQAATNAAYLAQIQAAPQYWGQQGDILAQLRQAQQQMSQSPSGLQQLQQILAGTGR